MSLSSIASRATQKTNVLKQKKIWLPQGSTRGHYRFFFFINDIKTKHNRAFTTTIFKQKSTLSKNLLEFCKLKFTLIRIEL